MFLNRETHHSRLHHLPQFHQIFKGVLIQNDSVHHGVNHAFLEAVADERSFRTLAFQHAQIGQYLDGLADAAPGDAQRSG